VDKTVEKHCGRALWTNTVSAVDSRIYVDNSRSKGYRRYPLAVDSGVDKRGNAVDTGIVVWTLDVEYG
jgi:hypothetical protein